MFSIIILVLMNLTEVSTIPACPSFVLLYTRAIPTIYLFEMCVMMFCALVFAYLYLNCALGKV